jgi:plastocyanin
MSLKRMSFLFLALAIAGVLAGTAISATAAPGHASVLIRHQTHGCHSWSVNGGHFAASHSITLRHGGWLTVTNNDVMPHRLVLTSGPALRITNATLKHMGASVKLTLTKPGIYHFTTKAGEDYMSGVKTSGEDNVLKLTVTVR